MKLRGALIIGLLASSTPAWAARDLCKMLKDKGTLTDVEYNECKAAQEKEDAATESKAKEVLATKLPAWLDKFTPFGDIRTRYEGFYQDGSHPISKGRIRVRVGMRFTLNEEVSATVRLGSGNSNDPISLNQDLGQAFTGKGIHLDQAYITVTPGKSVGMTPGLITIMGGKIPVTEYKVSELVWDDDLEPEGAAEIFQLFTAKEGPVRGVRLNTVQYILDPETSTSQAPWTIGGQLVGDFALGSAGTWTLGFGDYSYQGMNTLARRYLSPTVKNSSPPPNTKSNSNYNSSLANSNRVTLDSFGDITGFVSGFNIINTTTEMNFANPFGIGLPAGVFGDMAYNTLSDSKNTGVNLGVGLGGTGKGWYAMNLANQGQWGTSYTYAWVEKDAVPSQFSFSDLNYSIRSGSSTNSQKGSTNVTGHIFRFDYMPIQGLQLTAKEIISSALDRGDATNTDGTRFKYGNSPVLFRTQLDAVVRF